MRQRRSGTWLERLHGSSHGVLHFNTRIWGMWCTGTTDQQLNVWLLKTTPLSQRLSKVHKDGMNREKTWTDLTTQKKMNRQVLCFLYCYQIVVGFQNAKTPSFLTMRWWFLGGNSLEFSRWMCSWRMAHPSRNFWALDVWKVTRFSRIDVTMSLSAKCIANHYQCQDIEWLNLFACTACRKIPCVWHVKVENIVQRFVCTWVPGNSFHRQKIVSDQMSPIPLAEEPVDFPTNFGKTQCVHTIYVRNTFLQSLHVKPKTARSSE